MSTNTRSSKTDTVGDLPTQKDLSLAEEVPATTSIPEIVKCSVCYIPAALQCSKCQVAFCGAIHQKLVGFLPFFFDKNNSFLNASFIY